MTSNHYSLFCGVFLYEKVINPNSVSNWTVRLTNVEGFNQHLKRTYYDNYLSNIVSGQHTSSVSHYTLNGFAKENLTIELGQNVPEHITMPYFDIYLFKEGIGIFAFKAQLSSEFNYEKISRCINHLRNPLSPIVYNQKSGTLIGLIGETLKKVVSLKSNWSEFITQLKTYTIIEDQDAGNFTAELDKTLFNLSHVLPVGTTQSSIYQPSEKYFDEVMEKNTISVFGNWKAIALFDTFTRISVQQTDSFKTWENDYFLIYVHCLYTKFQLYLLNNQLRDLLIVSNQTSTLKSKFIEFVNDYNLAYISYKFLPNLLYEKMTDSLDTQKELEKMEIKVERINEAYQARKSQQLNRILLVISVFSVISVITDLTQWLAQLGASPGVVYSVSLGLMAVSLISAFYLIKKRWKI